MKKIILILAGISILTACDKQISGSRPADKIISARAARGEFIKGSVYEPGDVVLYNELKYLCINVTDSIPSDTVNWTILTTEQTWKVAQNYNLGELVSYKGSLYRCTMPHCSNTSWLPGSAPFIWAQAKK